MGFGVRMEHIAPPTRVTFHLFGIDGVVVALQRLYVIIGAVVVLGALWIFLRRTRFGLGAPGLRAGSGGGLSARNLDHPDRTPRDVHRRGHGGRRGRPRGAPGAHLSVHGPFGDRHRLHRHHRGRARQSGRRGGGGDPLRVRAYLRDDVLRRRRRRHRRPAADAGGAHRAADGVARRPGNGPEPADATFRAEARLHGWGFWATLAGVYAVLVVLPHLLSYSQKEVAGISGHQRPGRGELPAVDPHRASGRSHTW